MGVGALLAPSNGWRPGCCKHSIVHRPATLQHLIFQPPYVNSSETEKSCPIEKELKKNWKEISSLWNSMYFNAGYKYPVTPSTLTNGTQPTLRKLSKCVKPRNQSTSAKRTLLSEKRRAVGRPAAGSHCPAGRSYSQHSPRACLLALCWGLANCDSSKTDAGQWGRQKQVNKW